MQNSGSAPPVDINSPGEPRFVTFYQALESASIRNENLGAEDVSQRQTLTGVVTKVDSNATVPNGASNDIANNNDTIASITATTTSSPDTTTVDITTAVQSADNSLASRIGAGNSTEGSPETATTTVQTPANTDASREETTPIPTSESPGTTVPVSTIPNTPPTDANVPATTVPFDTTETITIEASTSVAGVTSAALSSTESISTEPVTSTETTEITSLPATEAVNAGGSILASQNLQTASDTPGTTVSSPIIETHVPPEATTMPGMNDTESIETTMMQQPEETTPRTTESIDAVEDIETNIIQQSDTTIPSQTTEITSTAEPTTTEEISNDIIEIRATVAPALTSTFRTRLIDYAQDILSRLQDDGFSTVRTPAIQKPTVTPVSPELFNAIPDSSSTNTGSAAQPEETTTVREVESGNVGTTVSSDDVELVQTMTNGPEVTTRNTIDLNTAPQSQSNGQETNARDTLDSSTTTGQTLSSIVGNATSDPEPMTTAQDTRAPSIDEETTITPIPTPKIVDSVTENDPRSSNDTLLAELMTIAKTLFTEAMNDTRQSTQTDGMVGNDAKNRSVSSNGTSEATTAPSELSKPLENTTEHINVITPIDLLGNEREDNSTRGPVVGSKISLVESNARPAENPVDVGDVITMSLSQIKTETPNTIMVTVSMSSELTTNTPDSQLSNPIESSNNNTEQQTITTISNNEVELSNQLSEFVTDLTTNNPIMSFVTANTEGMLPDTNEPTMSDIEAVTELITSVVMTEINVVQTNAVDTTNQTLESTTIVPASDLQVTNNQSLIANALDIATTLSTVSDTSDTQPFGTEPPITESVRNLVNSTDTTTNRFNDIITNTPQTLTDLVSETPNLIARFQDTTATTTTAQGTAGSRIIQPEQTTETIITTITTVPTVTASSTIPTTDSTTSPVSSTDATTIPSSSVEPTVATTTTTTSTTTLQTTSTEASSRSELTTTVGSTSEMTTTVDINENLVSTETTTDISTTQGTTVTPTEIELNTISRINGEETTTMMMTTTSAAPPTNMSTTATISTTAQTTVLNRIPPSSAFTPFGSLNTGSYLGRFGGSQMTSIPRLGSSKTPVRDYLIYGIYPNKTIVRKRPEDNVIDGRNVDSPYVIFGIYPDGRLVRKFPNGTIIPDSPRNPVEVVFTLRTTTTTNRPAPRPYYYNQANQAGVYNNQYQAPIYDSNGRPVDDLTGGAQNPGPLDFGLVGNAIGVTPGGPNFATLGPPASIPSTNKMVSLSHLFIKIVLYTRNEFDQESNRG